MNNETDHPEKKKRDLVLSMLKHHALDWGYWQKRQLRKNQSFTCLKVKNRQSNCQEKHKISFDLPIKDPPLSISSLLSYFSISRSKNVIKTKTRQRIFSFWFNFISHFGNWNFIYLVCTPLDSCEIMVSFKNCSHVDKLWIIIINKTKEKNAFHA